ncbi:MAG: hypothetical protein ACRD30_09555 [Bryobacteraceae bacterium]
MDAQPFITGIVSIVFYSLILFAVYKIHQIGNELGEIKDMLRRVQKQYRRNFHRGNAVIA